MRDVHLHGALGAKYGECYRLDVETAADAVRALCANFPEIVGDLQDGVWHIVRGEDPGTGFSLGEEEIADFRLGNADLHIIPATVGGRNDGLLKAVIGIALIGISFGFGAAGVLAMPIAPSLGIASTWGAAMGSLGLSLALAGVSTMLAPEQKYDADKDKSSDLFSSLVPVAREGSGIPVAYGEVVAQGLLISVDLDVIQDNIAESTALDPAVTTALDTYQPNTTTYEGGP